MDYIIPGNDDAIRAIQLYLKAAADVILEGRNRASTGAEDEFVEIEEAPKAEEAPKSEEAQGSEEA